MKFAKVPSFSAAFKTNFLGATAILLMLLSHPTTAVAARLTLVGQPTQILEGEPIELTLRLENNEDHVVAFSPTAVVPRTFLSIDGGWRQCMKPGDVSPGSGADPRWHVLVAGESTTVGHVYVECLCDEWSPSSCKEWFRQAGTYTLKVQWTHPASKAPSSKAPVPVVLSGTLESNTLEVQVVRPGGLDGQAFAWAEERKLAPIDYKILDAFPTSTYAAHAVRFLVRDVLSKDPALVVNAISVDQFLHREHTYVQGPGGRADYRAVGPEEGARARLAWIDGVLRDHPEIWFANELRLSKAIHLLALKETSAAEALMSEIAAGVNKDEPSMMAEVYLDAMAKAGMIQRESRELAPASFGPEGLERKP